MHCSLCTTPLLALLESPSSALLCSPLLSSVLLSVNTTQYGVRAVYTVRLFHEGGWRFIMVDDYVPVSLKHGRPLFAHAKSRQELWVPVLEKAFAKLYGSYASM